MFLAPPPDDDHERARAAIAAEGERIVEQARHGVDAEVGRLDAAKQWAFDEMDRVTARAEQRLGDGMDPDEVQRRTEEEIAAVVAKASAPGFDPRPPPTAAPAPAGASAAMATAPPTPPAPVRRALAPAPQPRPAEPPQAPDAVATTPGPTCACNSRPSGGLFTAVVLAVVLARPRARA